METMPLPPDLREAAEEIGPGVVADRRDIHQHPELGYEERRTSALVDARLRQLGLDVRTGVGGTGVVGLLRGGKPGKTVLLRADMDALPILEENQTGYASQYPGVMHACGHDAHTSILLGVARVLADRKEQLRGTVKFMFQPAEEGGGGAPKMIEDGVLTDPPVDAAFALHVDHERLVGNVSIRPGLSNSSLDRFTIVVRGKGGHAAWPQDAIDPIVVGAHIITALQTIVAREVSPIEPAVVTVGSLTSGTTYNVIPDTATITGSVRAYNESVRAFIQERVGDIARGITSAMRATAMVDYRVLYPILSNDLEKAALVRETLIDLLGAETVLPRDPIMAAEDFAFVLQRVPGALMFLGVRDPAWAAPRPVHTATFDLNESALPIGVAALAASAIRFLEEG
jgi:amidohydrolase